MTVDTTRIENDLETSRHKLSETIDELGRKLSPGQLLDDAVGMAQDKAGQVAGNIGRRIRDNPLPTFLLAAGVAWWIVERNRSRHRDDWRTERRYRSLEETRWSTPRQADETNEEYDERVHAAYGAALGLRRGAQEAAHMFKARVGKAMSAAQHAAGGVRRRMAAQGERLAHGAMDARRGAQDMYMHNPLAAGAIAVAVGALIGGATPLSDMERDTLGDVADAASRAGANLAEKGAHLAERAADTVQHAADDLQRTADPMH